MTTTPSARAVAERRFRTITTTVFVVLALFLAFAAFTTFTRPASTAGSAVGLPNPMGGVAHEAPGHRTGTAEFGGLTVDGVEVAMGAVPLDVTVVPSWELRNPTAAAVTIVPGLPQVLAGCCPGPVYVDGHLVEAGAPVSIPAGGSAVVQFPLQMHAGMDGPHHLVIPVTAGAETGMLHVTGDFTDEAPAA